MLKLSEYSSNDQKPAAEENSVESQKGVIAIDFVQQ